jgi:hypothetical protein
MQVACIIGKRFASFATVDNMTEHTFNKALSTHSEEFGK